MDHGHPQEPTSACARRAFWCDRIRRTPPREHVDLAAEFEGGIVAEKRRNSDWRSRAGRLLRLDHHCDVVGVNTSAMVESGIIGRPVTGDR